MHLRIDWGVVSVYCGILGGVQGVFCVRNGSEVDERKPLPVGTHIAHKQHQPAKAAVRSDVARKQPGRRVVENKHSARIGALLTMSVNANTVRNRGGGD